MTPKHRFQDVLLIMDRWLEYNCFISQIPGLAVGILVDNEVVFQKEYGYANLQKKAPLTKNHLFRCASHAKLLTASAIMKLSNEEKIGIEDKVVTYLPWFSSEHDPNLQEITIFHLLTHTSGIVTDGNFPNGRRSGDLNQVIELVKQGISCFKAGENIKYSNFGYMLLGLIIEVVSGTSFSDYITNSIFAPLQMNNSVISSSNGNLEKHAIGYSNWYPDRNRKEVNYEEAPILDAPAGGLSSNVNDMLKFLQVHFTDNDILLPDPIKEEMQKVQVDINGAKRGLGFEIFNFPDGRTVHHIIGGINGFRSFSALMQEQKLAITIMSNATNAQVFSWSAAIMDFFNMIATQGDNFGKEAINAPYTEESGYYESPYGIFIIGSIGEKLVIFDADSWNPAASPCILVAEGNGKFQSPVSLPFAKENEYITFTRDTDGNLKLQDSSGCEVRRFEFDPSFRL